ncbi:MAG: thioredoxin family protein [Planctomycetes bacterium]|nr:thioredoxin family protein [Planctomycetota bacterium]
MKKNILFISILFALFSGLSAGEGWITDFKKAKELAKKENKPIFANFTGSDWCGTCVFMEKNVFSKKSFLDYAKEKFVLFMADYPRETAQDPVLAKQNEALAAQYRVRGFPTLLVLNAKGDPLAQSEYFVADPEDYIRHLNSFFTMNK